MKNLKLILVGIAFLLTSTLIYGQKIKLVVNYSDAQIFLLSGTTIIKPAIGVGSAEIKLSNKSSNRIVVIKEGFEPLIQEYPKTRKWPKEVRINLQNRLVEITAEPYDADIYVNGTNVGREKYNLIVTIGNSQTIELKKAGYEVMNKTYYNVDGQSEPPLKDHMKLVNRLVSISVVPTSADIYVNDNLRGEGNEDVVIREKECVTIRVEKEGYENDEKIFCNKDSEKEPPLNYNFTLTDRIVKLKVTPESAEIKINGKVVGLGEYDVKVPHGDCSQVIVFKEGYIKKKLNYCNSKEYQEPPVNDHIELVEDEAFKTSVSTDMANVNVTLEVKEGLAEIDAWKLISSIVMAEFDVLEITDKETGYIRSAWQVQSFNGESTIRTRVIVKMGDSNPLKYVIKIASERAEGVVSVKDDQDFEEWNRILKRYQYIIGEAQARLK